MIVINYTLSTVLPALRAMTPQVNKLLRYS
jgi:hypothetical protein